jgi:hypothetical protein
LEELIRFGYAAIFRCASLKRGAVEGPSAEQVTGLSKDTIKRRYPHLIRKLSERREGMQLGDALAIAAGEAT